MRTARSSLWLAAGMAGIVLPSALSVPTSRPERPAPGVRLMALAAEEEKKPPKESDFPELYVKEYPKEPAPGYAIYTLSGGEDPKSAIVADDDVTVRLNGEMIFADNDGWACPDERGGKWHGAPITFHAKPEDKVTVILYDLAPDAWKLGPIYLHRADGKRALLQPEVMGESDPQLDNMLFADAPPGPEAKRNKQHEATKTIKDVIP
jgi:hypothetical protein